MNVPDDDDGLDQMLGGLGTPPAAKPGASAGELLKKAGPLPPPPSGPGYGLLGAGIAALLGGGLLLGGMVGGAALVLAVQGQGAGGTAAPTMDERAGGTPAPTMASPTRGVGAAVPAALSTVTTPERAGGTRGTPAPTMEDVGGTPAPTTEDVGGTPAPTMGSVDPPRDVAAAVPAALSTVASPQSAVETPAPALASAPVQTTTTVQIPPPDRLAGPRYAPMVELDLVPGATSPLGPWQSLDIGAGPSLSVGLHRLSAGRSVRTVLGGYADGSWLPDATGARAGFATGAEFGLAFGGERRHLELGAGVGGRWLAALPDAGSPLSAEAGWLILGAGPYGAAVVELRPGLVGVARIRADVAALDLDGDGVAEPAPWLTAGAGVGMTW